MNSIPAEVAATGEGTLSRELLFMHLRDSNSGLATDVSTVVLVVSVGSTAVCIGAALTVLDRVAVRSIVGAGAGVETAVEADGRPAVVVDREAREVALSVGAAEAEENETPWENMPTLGAAGVDEQGAWLGFSGSRKMNSWGKKKETFIRTVSQQYERNMLLVGNSQKLNGRYIMCFQARGMCIQFLELLKELPLFYVYTMSGVSVW